jgi:Uma2 family endonuclease
MSRVDVGPRSARIIGSMSAQIELDELHRFTTDEYRRLVEAGAFEDFAPVELIDGLLVRKDMKSREHEQAIEWLSRYLFRGVDDERYAVRVASSLTLETSAPEPDLALIPRSAPRPYHPATAALAIEVSVSSLRRDLDIKAVIYARALVAEYWVVDIAGRRIVVHRAPRGDGYEQVVEVRTGGQIAAPAGLPQLAVEDLLRVASA